MVRGPGLTVTVKAGPTAKIDAALLNDEAATALDGDIVAMLSWLRANGFVELDTNGNAFYRATNKMLQIKTLLV